MGQKLLYLAVGFAIGAVVPLVLFISFFVRKNQDIQPRYVGGFGSVGVGESVSRVYARLDQQTGDVQVWSPQIILPAAPTYAFWPLEFSSLYSFHSSTDVNSIRPSEQTGGWIEELRRAREMIRAEDERKTGPNGFDSWQAENMSRLAEPNTNRSSHLLNSE